MISSDMKTLNAEVKSIALPDGLDACPHQHGGELSGQGDVEHLARSSQWALSAHVFCSLHDPRDHRSFCWPRDKLRQ